MRSELKGLRALVTGASRGIGATIVRYLAGSGVQLALTGRDAEALSSIAASISDTGVAAGIIVADLAEPDAPNRVIDKAVETLGGLDILINNAGIAGSISFADTTFEDWEAHMAINARAPFFLCQNALPHLKRSPSPAIVQVASVVSTKGYVDQAAYSASKHALLGFTKSMSKEIQNAGIRVHTISPGGVATDLVTSVRPDIDTTELIQPEDVAEFIIYLLEHRGNAMTDEIIIRRSTKEPWL